MKKVNLDIIYAQKISSVKFYLEQTLVSAFKKCHQPVMSRNIRIFEQNDPQILFVFVFVLIPEYEYIRIFVRKICCIRKYLYIHSVHNVASEYIRIFICVHFLIFPLHW